MTVLHFLSWSLQPYFHQITYLNIRLLTFLFKFFFFIILFVSIYHFIFSFT